jgi:hypothetical protein
MSRIICEVATATIPTSSFFFLSPSPFGKLVIATSCEQKGKSWRKVKSGVPEEEAKMLGVAELCPEVYLTLTQQR